MQKGSKQNLFLKIHRGVEIITESQICLEPGCSEVVLLISWSNHGLIIIKTISSMVIIKNFQSQHSTSNFRVYIKSCVTITYLAVDFLNFRVQKGFISVILSAKLVISLLYPSWWKGVDRFTLTF